MNETELIIFTGNIGCGKSFLARKFAAMGYSVVSNDAIVEMIGGGEYGLFDIKKKEVYHAAEQIITEASFSSGHSVVIDRTCIDREARQRFIDIGKANQAKIISYDWGSGEPEDLQRRLNNHRHTSISQWGSVFNKYIDRYEQPSINEGFAELRTPPRRYQFYAFDFDGTIVKNEFPNIGKVNLECIEFMKSIWKDLSNVIIIWTCRDGDPLSRMKGFLIREKIPFDFINENPVSNLGSRKIFAHFYIDDRNMMLVSEGRKK